jgi:quercetin dioxygenase-like cupin family protein
VVTSYRDRKITHMVFERTFDANTAASEFVWHRDDADRIVRVIQGSGWKFQADNALPVELHAGDEFYVGAFTYHRIIPGEHELVVEITQQ